VIDKNAQPTVSKRKKPWPASRCGFGFLTWVTHKPPENGRGPRKQGRVPGTLPELRPIHKHLDAMDIRPKPPIPWGHLGNTNWPQRPVGASWGVMIVIIFSFLAGTLARSAQKRGFSENRVSGCGSS